MLCDRLCTDDRESRHTELAEPGTSVYSAGTGMETSDLGTVSTRALPEYYGLQLQFCSFIIQLELLWSGRLELLNIRCIFFRA